jgi:hypothetical protein
VQLARGLSPLHAGYHALRWPDMSFDPVTLAQWLGLGVVGEAGLPWPWLLPGAIVAAISCGWAYLSALRERETRTTGVWAASYAALWALACGFGVFHPRYSLLLWVVLAVFVTRLALRGGYAARLACTLGAAHMLIVLGLVYTGRGFFKADLNTLSAADCRVASAARSASLVVATYPRLAALVESRCDLHADLLTLPSIWMTRDEDEQLRDLRAQLHDAGNASTLWLFSTHFDSSIALTEARVRGLLEKRCQPEPARSFGAAPHPWLHRDRGADFRRYQLQRWTCQSAARDVNSSAWR